MFIITTSTINNPGSNELTSYNDSDEYKRTNNNNNNNNSFKFGKDNQFSLKHFLEELTQNSSRFQIN